MKLDLANFSPELQKKTIVNGLPFCKNKYQEKSVSDKIAAKTLMYEYLQRRVIFSPPVLVKLTKKQIIILKTR